LYQAIHRKIAVRASARVRNRRRLTSSTFNVAKKLSATALMLL